VRTVTLEVTGDSVSLNLGSVDRLAAGVEFTGAALTRARRGDDIVKQTYKRPAEIPFPIDNPYTPEKAALGKALYFDPRLSGAQNLNCATCHNPSFGWEVPVKTPVGAGNKPLARQSPPSSMSPGSILSSGMGVRQAPRNRPRDRSNPKWK
jgi:cytochrome c peroxidase